jgi:hypothetical protein
MKYFDYKGYFVIIERNHNGSILATARNEDTGDCIKNVFYDYSMSYAVEKMRFHVRYRSTNNIVARS